MLQGRVDVVEADVTQAPPHGSWDVGVLCNVVQVLPRAEAHRALVNVGAAIESGGSLYIFGHALEDSRLAPANAVGMNLVFLSVYDGGQSYTEGDIAPGSPRRDSPRSRSASARARRRHRHRRAQAACGRGGSRHASGIASAPDLQAVFAVLDQRLAGGDHLLDFAQAVIFPVAGMAAAVAAGVPMVAALARVGSAALLSAGGAGGVATMARTWQGPKGAAAIALRRQCPRPLNGGAGGKVARLRAAPCPFGSVGQGRDGRGGHCEGRGPARYFSDLYG